MVYGYRGLSSYPLLILITANILLFIAVFVHGELIYLFGLQPANWLDRPWTIVTNLFVHGSLWHVSVNMLTLYSFGGVLSMLIGKGRFLLVYFLGGIVGNLVYVLFGSPYSIAIGASGAIFAVGGVLAVMRPKSRVYIFPVPSPLPLWAAVLVGFLIISFLPFMAWQAHLGGLVLGLIAGYLFRKQLRITL